MAEEKIINTGDCIGAVYNVEQTAEGILNQFDKTLFYNFVTEEDGRLSKENTDEIVNTVFVLQAACKGLLTDLNRIKHYLEEKEKAEVA